eukprot:5487995-Pyramimonas_sp.AAC.1
MPPLVGQQSPERGVGTGPTSSISRVSHGMDDPDLDPFKQLADDCSELFDAPPEAVEGEGSIVQEAPAARSQDAWGSAASQSGAGAKSGQLRAAQGLASGRLPGCSGDACNLAVNQAVPSTARAGQGASV